jgi:hypothetical protein
MRMMLGQFVIVALPAAVDGANARFNAYVAY